MTEISAAYAWLINALRALSGVVVFCIFALITVDVGIRLTIDLSIYFFGENFGISPWGYSSALVEYGLLYFAMFAAPWLVRIKGHVFIDAVTQLLTPRAQGVLAKFVYLICVTSCLIFSFFSLNLLIEAFASGEIDTRGEDMPLWALLLPLPFCFFLVAIEFGRFLIGLDSMYGSRTDVRDNV